MNYIKDNLKNTNVSYLTDPAARAQGEKYLQTLMTQLLQPNIPTKFESLQNKLIANTYKAQLGFSPKFAAQNITQRYATRTQVSGAARSLSKQIDGDTWDGLLKNLTTGENAVTADASTADNVGKVTGIMQHLQKFDPGQRVEKGNVDGAFKAGVSQGIINSDEYKAAIASGMKPAEAAAEALKNDSVRDLAIRNGNMVVNTTQFGGNFAAKPEFLRDSGSFLGLSKKWYQQYQRFPVGMMQVIGNIVKPDDARALDILRRGDPRQTPIVDYYKATQSLQNGVDDLIKGVKKGEVSSVSLEDAQNYKNLLTEAQNNLKDQMKDASEIRAGKTALNVGKMWAAASAIQFLFDGGQDSKGSTSGEVGKAISYGAPINIPTKNNNPLLGAQIPSSPVTTHGISGRKLLNFVPVVGAVVNRGRDISKFGKLLTGDNSQ